MPGERRREGEGDAPRTDLPGEREPYYEGYFGTDEEEGVEREREVPGPASGDEAEEAPRRGDAGEGAIRGDGEGI